MLMVFKICIPKFSQELKGILPATQSLILEGGIATDIYWNWALKNTPLTFSTLTLEVIDVGVFAKLKSKRSVASLK